MSELHLLRSLKLPWRFEGLISMLGPKVVELLVEPSKSTRDALQLCTLSINQSQEGLFVPIFGESGTGKTTLANSLNTFSPNDYAPTASHSGVISFDALRATARLAREKLTIDDKKILPINIDDRESNPPSSMELSALKRFLRSADGSRSLIFWPETTESIANDIARAYKSIGGASVIDLPMKVSGPEKATWQEIVTQTLHLCNNIPNLEDLGVNPKSYSPESWSTIGEYIKAISNDFTRHIAQLLAATQKPINLIIVFASESSEPGSLTKITSPSKPGLLDANGLLKATGESVIGKWWAERRGLLIQTIYKLNARAFCLTPAASVTILRAYGPTAVKDDLIALGIGERNPRKVVEYLERTDLGKYLTRGDSFSFEDRGTPADDARAAFSAIAEKGFTYGKDKKLNESIAEAIKSFMTDKAIEFTELLNETGLSFCKVLIPDNSIVKKNEVVCVEYTWRKGEFLSTGNKSATAQYALTKLKNYARELGWTTG